jgi:hypothetical protein
MSGQQHHRRIRVQAHHRDSGLERLDREDQLATQAGCEVLDVARYIAAWEVDELEAIEDDEQRNRPEWPRLLISTKCR